MKPPTKAEILITRKCNLRCSSCAMVKDTPELTPEQWELVPQKLQELGISFAPIYGAEPLMVMSSLTKFIKSSRGRFPVSIITNGTLLNEKNISELKSAGLDSITLSADLDPIDEFSRIKTQSTLSKLDTLKKEFRDVEVICTITKRDWHLLPEFIKLMSAKGIWVHFDFYHSPKGQPGSKCSGNEELPSIDDIEEGALEIYKMKEVGYLIHPSSESLIYLLTCPNQAFFEYWKCEGGSFCTIDTDGSVFLCDDFQPEELRGRFPILEYGGSWTWDECVETWRTYLPKCPGCFWMTHLQSEIWWNELNEDWKKEIKHV